jgi:hypothetical protein
MGRAPRFLKILAFVIVLSTLILGSSVSAAAWCSGTHIWIVSNACKLAGGWVNTSIASAHVMDPDKITMDWNNMHYDAWDSPHSGNAPATVLKYYNLAVSYLKAGNVNAASQQVGLMAHYYGDIWCPWHTTYTTSNASAQKVYHPKYEFDAAGHEPSAPSYTPVRVSDPYGATVNAAYYSHNKYSIIANAYISGKGYAGSGVDSTTKDLLTRAADGLANLIYSIKLDAANIEQTDKRIVYTGTWSAFSKVNASGGSYIRSSAKNASVTIAFTGTSLDIFGMKGTTGGIVDFYVDGATAPSSTVNLLLSAPQYKLKLFSLTDSSGGTHVVVLRPNAKSPSGQFINLDFVDVNGTLISPPRS